MVLSFLPFKNRTWKLLVEKHSSLLHDETNFFKLLQFNIFFDFQALFQLFEHKFMYKNSVKYVEKILAYYTLHDLWQKSITELVHAPF